MRCACFACGGGAGQGDRRPADQGVDRGRQQVVGLLAPRHHLAQPGAVLDLDHVGEALVAVEQLGEEFARDQVEQRVFQRGDREAHPPAAQQAEFAEVAARRQAVVQRAVAAEDLHRAAAHHVPELGGLAEFDDLLAGLVVAHIDRRRHALQGVLRQGVERRVGAEEVEDLELFDLHGMGPWMSVGTNIPPGRQIRPPSRLHVRPRAVIWPGAAPLPGAARMPGP